MKHHFTYKLMILAAVMAFAFVLTACNNGTVQDKEQETAAPAQDTMEATQAAEETGAIDDAMNEESPVNDEQNMDGEKVFTPEELSEYDGKDGRPAYVAVDGVVYDVSDKALWAGGEHQNRVSAGQDLSEAILSSPHGKAKLEELPIVGTLAEE